MKTRIDRKEIIGGTIDENLKQALLEENHAKLCGPSDPYYRLAKANVEYYLDCAAALERGEKTITVKSSYLGLD